MPPVSPSPTRNRPAKPSRLAASISWRARFARVMRRFRGDESGSYVIMAGILMPALVGAMGVGTEAGLLYLKRRSMQNAADSAAISAATTYYVQSNNSGLATQSQAIAAGYGFVNGASG